MSENRRTTAMRLPPNLLLSLEFWCKAQRPPVTKTAVIEMLISDFLTEQERNGWTPPSRK